MTMINQLQELIRQGQEAGVKHGQLIMSFASYRSLADELKANTLYFTVPATNQTPEFMGCPILLDSRTPPGMFYFREIPLNKSDLPYDDD